MDYRLYSRSEQSADYRHVENEDSAMYSRFSFMKDKTIRILVVADGMGGLQDGKKASVNAVKGFMKAFYEQILEQYIDTDMESFSLKYVIKDIKRCLRHAIQKANTCVCRGAEHYQMTGTTISAICLVDDCAVLANVGDSPIYLYRKQNHRVKLISKLQTKAEQDVAAGVYKRGSSSYYKNNHILYCSLGQYDRLQEEDIYTTAVGNLQEGDSLLIGTDGCFGNMNETLVGSLLNECSMAEEGFLLEQIFSLARMDKDDDQTAFLCIAEGRG